LAQLILLSVSAFAQNLGEVRVSGNYVDARLQDVLKDIESNHSLRFFYMEEWLSTTQVTQQFNQKPVLEVLELLLNNSDLSYVLYDDTNIIIGKKDRIRNLKSSREIKTRQSRIVDIDSRFPVMMAGDSTTIGSSENMINFKLVDRNDGYPLEGASIYFEKLEYTTSSDANGKAGIVLPKGIFQMEIRMVGYEPFIRNLSVLSNGIVRIEMDQEIIELREVVISGEGPAKRLMDPQAGVVTITPKQIKEIPVFLGEADLIKTILTIPGVSTIGEGAPGFFVRGGNIDQNLILQDEVIFSNSSHALGFFSLFNPDLISSVQLYKGNIPAQFGGRLSSVLDVQLKGNNYTSTTLSGGVGTVMSKLAIETPIVKDKISLLAGGRISYSDWILRAVKIPQIMESEASFYDFNIKMSAKISKNGSINAGYFQSFDRVNFQGEAGFEWTIKNFSFNWNQGIGRTVQSEFIAVTGQSDNLNYDPSGLIQSELANGLQFFKLKENVVIPIKNHLIVTGGEWIYYKPKDEVLRTSGTLEEQNNLPKDYGQEWGFYLNDEWEISESFALSAGLRTSIFISEERPAVVTNDRQYINYEPRISVRYGVGASSSIKASYNKVSQYIHLLSNTTGVLPIDQWVLSNSRISPSKSTNFSLGYFKNFDLNSWESSAELFYRRMTDVIEFKDFADLVLNPGLEDEIIQGEGKAYGIEFFVKRHTGKVKGSLSYTYSRTFIKPPQAAEDIELDWFPAKFDRPHNLNLVMDWTVNRKSKFGLVFNFNSGRPITAPISFYNLGDVVVPNYSTRNEYRIPNYHRLDLAYTYKRNAVKKKKYQDSITFSIYNIYSRRNAFSVFFRKDPNSPAKAYKLSVLGSAFPSITYTFEFK